MKRILLLLLFAILCSLGFAQDKAFVDSLKLADYKPVSLFKTHGEEVLAPSYPVIDMHTHAYEQTVEGIQRWLKEMDANNIEKAIVMTGSHGARFDELCDLFKSVSDRFEVWCGIDMTGWGSDDFPESAIRELERCWRRGATGVGELSDKGLGDRISRQVAVPGLHFNSDLFVPIFAKCAELGMPVNCHIGDPIWMYQNLDEHNDGYMNAVEWKIDMSKPGVLSLYELVATMEETCAKNPKTTFIACHFMNICHDYEYLGEVLDRNPNLYIDNAARQMESSATPRATKRFYEKYSGRILFGTDNYPSASMYDLQWRILESEDEHFYPYQMSYHWPLHGLGLSKKVLKKVYRTNALKVLKK